MACGCGCGGAGGLGLDAQFKQDRAMTSGLLAQTGLKQNLSSLFSSTPSGEPSVGGGDTIYYVLGAAAVIAAGYFVYTAVAD